MFSRNRFFSDQRKQTNRQRNALPEANSSHLNIGRAPKGNESSSSSSNHPVLGANCQFSGRANIQAKIPKKRNDAMDSQNSATQAWCCVHQQLGCPSSSDPEDFDCSVLTEWKTRSWNGEEMKFSSGGLKIKSLGITWGLIHFWWNFPFSEKKIVHEQKELFVWCLLCWMVFTKITRYFLKDVFVGFSSVLVAPEFWQISGNSP